MTLLFKPKIGSWELLDLIKHPDATEFQEFLQFISTKVTQLESRPKDLHDNISTLEFENFLHSIEEISEKVSTASGYGPTLVTKMGMSGSNIANRPLFFD